MSMAATEHDTSVSRCRGALGAVDNIDEVDDYVARLVDAAPPLSPAQLDQVRGLLSPIATKGSGVTSPSARAS